MNETTTLLKVGSADLVLRMIEAGVVMRDLTLENPIRAIREISHDLTGTPEGQAGQRPRGERAGDPAGVLRQGHATSSSRRGGDATVEQVLDLWGRTLTAVETGDLGLVDREIDWVTKYQLIERYRAKHDLPLSSPRVAQLDLAYHDINRDRGLYYLLERKGAGRPGDHRPGGLRGQVGAAADHPRPAARRVHQDRRRRSAATSPSTGCTSSSTTRRSAPCCARTPSARSTSGWTS